MTQHTIELLTTEVESLNETVGHLKSSLKVQRERAQELEKLLEASRSNRAKTLEMSSGQADCLSAIREELGVSGTLSELLGKIRELKAEADRSEERREYLEACRMEIAPLWRMQYKELPDRIKELKKRNENQYVALEAVRKAFNFTDTVCIDQFGPEVEVMREEHKDKSQEINNMTMWLCDIRDALGIKCSISWKSLASNAAELRKQVDRALNPIREKLHMSPFFSDAQVVMRVSELQSAFESIMKACDVKSDIIGLCPVMPTVQAVKGLKEQAEQEVSQSESRKTEVLQNIRGILNCPPMTLYRELPELVQNLQKENEGLRQTNRKRYSHLSKIQKALGVQGVPFAELPQAVQALKEQKAADPTNLAERNEWQAAEIGRCWKAISDVQERLKGWKVT